MLRARSLARLNGRMLNTYSRRTTTALRAALPLRLALPRLEPVLALNVAKEVQKDTLVILRAGNRDPESSQDESDILPLLLQATKDIDRGFLGKLGAFPVDIVIRYDEIDPVRSRRLKLLYDASSKLTAAFDRGHRLRDALQANFSRDEFTHLLNDLFRLYAEETRSLSRSVRLPGPLVLLRDLVAQELLNVMLQVARPLAVEIAAIIYRPVMSDKQ